MCGSERRLRARRRKRTTSIRLQKPIAARTVSRFRGAHCALQCIIDSWQKLRRRRRRRIRYVLIAVCAFDVDVRRRCGLRTHVRVCTMLCCSRFWTHTHTVVRSAPPGNICANQQTHTHIGRFLLAIDFREARAYVRFQRPGSNSVSVCDHTQTHAAAPSAGADVWVCASSPNQIG